MVRFQRVKAWSDFAGIDHHCAGCQKPLSNPNALKTCVGIHCLPCWRFHYGLHSRLNPQRCQYCVQADELHETRHRRIALLLRDLGGLLGNDKTTPRTTPQTQASLLSTPIKSTAQSATSSPATSTVERSSKRDRKKQRHLSRVVVDTDYITLSEAQWLWQIFHPDHDLSEFFDRDAAIQFHQELQDLTEGYEDLTTLPDPDFLATANSLLSKLGIRSSTNKGSAEKLSDLRGLIIEDLRQYHTEKVRIAGRLRSFLAWAGRSCYKTILDFFEHRDWKTGAYLSTEAGAEADGKAKAWSANKKNDLAHDFGGCVDNRHLLPALRGRWTTDELCDENPDAARVINGTDRHQTEGWISLLDDAHTGIYGIDDQEEPGGHGAFAEDEEAEEQGHNIAEDEKEAIERVGTSNKDALNNSHDLAVVIVDDNEDVQNSRDCISTINHGAASSEQIAALVELCKPRTMWQFPALLAAVSPSSSDDDNSSTGSDVSGLSSDEMTDDLEWDLELRCALPTPAYVLPSEGVTSDRHVVIARIKRHLMDIEKTLLKAASRGENADLYHDPRDDGWRACVDLARKNSDEAFIYWAYQMNLSTRLITCGDNVELAMALVVMISAPEKVLDALCDRYLPRHMRLDDAIEALSDSMPAFTIRRTETATDTIASSIYKCCSMMNGIDNVSSLIRAAWTYLYSLHSTMVYKDLISDAWGSGQFTINAPLELVKDETDILVRHRPSSKDSPYASSISDFSVCWPFERPQPILPDFAVCTCCKPDAESKGKQVWLSLPLERLLLGPMPVHHATVLATSHTATINLAGGRRKRVKVSSNTGSVHDEMTGLVMKIYRNGDHHGPFVAKAIFHETFALADARSRAPNRIPYRYPVILPLNIYDWLADMDGKKDLPLPHQLSPFWEDFSCHGGSMKSFKKWVRHGIEITMYYIDCQYRGGDYMRSIFRSVISHMHWHRKDPCNCWVRHSHVEGTDPICYYCGQKNRKEPLQECSMRDCQAYRYFHMSCVEPEDLHLVAKPPILGTPDEALGSSEDQYEDWKMYCPDCVGRLKFLAGGERRPSEAEICAREENSLEAMCKASVPERCGSCCFDCMC